MAAKLYAALDVSLNKVAICAMDHEGNLVHETEVAACPDAIAAVLRVHQDQLERVGLEAGPTSEWLVRELAKRSIDAVLMETRQAHKALSAMTVKTDRSDARGLAHLLRMGWFRPVHVKTISAREQRVRLAARETLVRQVRDLENSVRGLLRSFGLRIPVLLRGRWSAAIRALIEGHPSLPIIFEPLLQARDALREHLAALDRQVRDAAREDRVCRQLMTAPGVGAIVAMTFRNHDRRSTSVPLLPVRRRLPRIDPKALPVGRDSGSAPSAKLVTPPPGWRCSRPPTCCSPGSASGRP